MAAKIHIERMMYRNSISVPGESAASYALIKLIPSGDEGAKPIGLNLAIVLDVSGSMYEEDGTGRTRLKRVQEAALAGIRRLRDDDLIAIVAFAFDARVVLPATKLADRTRIEETIRQVDLFDVDPGGTSMDQGIALGLQEVEKSAEPGRLSQVVILTDGETQNEEICRQLAEEARNKRIHFTVMGIGTEWNASLLKDLAEKAEGKWYYIDVEQAQEAERVFVEEFEHLSAATFTNVEMDLWPVKDVKVKRVRQVAPEIKELPLAERADRHLAASLGVLGKDKASRYILDLSVPRRPDGNYVLLQLEVSYAQTFGGREGTGKVPLQVQYTESGQGYINAEVARHIDEVQIYELNKNLQDAIAARNQAEAKRVAETISKKGELMGPRGAKKTMLAKQVLRELNAGGRVSKKTQLAVDDAARLAEEMPTPGS